MEIRRCPQWYRWIGVLLHGLFHCFVSLFQQGLSCTQWQSLRYCWDGNTVISTVIPTKIWFFCMDCFTASFHCFNMDCPVSSGNRCVIAGMEIQLYPQWSRLKFGSSAWTVSRFRFTASTWTGLHPVGNRCIMLGWKYSYIHSDPD